MSYPRCRHCELRFRSRPRGLCQTCYSTPGVRDLYPPGSANPATAKYIGRSGLNAGTVYPHHTDAPLPTPTDAPPGSLEKIRVLRERVRRGEQLHHPDDAQDVDAALLWPFEGLRYDGAFCPVLGE